MGIYIYENYKRENNLAILNITNTRLFESFLIVYLPRILALKIYTLCPQKEFICFVWISGKAAIITLCRIKRLVFVTGVANIISNHIILYHISHHIASHHITSIKYHISYNIHHITYII